MKKLIALALCVCTLAFSVNAQTNASAKQDENTSSVQTKSDAQNDVLALAPVEKSSEPQAAVSTSKELAKDKSLKNGHGWPSFKDKPWYYIGAGAFIVVVVVFYIVTGGQGWSSRG